jgi:hypothetical protein
LEVEFAGCFDPSWLGLTHGCPACLRGVLGRWPRWYPQNAALETAKTAQLTNPGKLPAVNTEGFSNRP